MIESSEHRTSRRAFLVKGAAAGALTLGAGRFLIDTPAALAGEALPAGDAAILKFLAAAELLEADLWKQYNELGGVRTARSPAEVAIGLTPRRSRTSTKTCPSTSTTTPTTSRATQTS